MIGSIKHIPSVVLGVAILFMIGGCRKSTDTDPGSASMVKSFDLYPSSVITTDRGFLVTGSDEAGNIWGDYEEFIFEVDEQGNTLWRMAESQLAEPLNMLYPYVGAHAYIDGEVYLYGYGYTDTVFWNYNYWFGKIENGVFTTLIDSIAFDSADSSYVNARIVGTSSEDLHIITPVDTFDTSLYYYAFSHLAHIKVRGVNDYTMDRIEVGPEIDGFYELDDVHLLNNELYILIEGWTPEYLFKITNDTEIEWVKNMIEEGPFSDNVAWDGDLGSNGNNLILSFDTWTNPQYDANIGDNIVQQKPLGFYEITSDGTISEYDIIDERGIYYNYRYDDDLSEIIGCGDFTGDINITGTPFFMEMTRDNEIEIVHFVDKTGMYLLNVKPLGDERYLVAGGHGRFEKSAIDDFFIAIFDKNEDQKTE